MSMDVHTLVPLAERPLHERVAAVVRGEMARYDVSQARMSRILGITQQSISRKRSGQTPYTLDELEAIAPLFGLQPDDLLRQARELRPVDPDGGAGLRPVPALGQTTD